MGIRGARGITSLKSKRSEPRSQRYLRQLTLPDWGAKEQERLARSSVLLVGCGGLGSSVAQLLVRAGLGYLRLVDGDCVALHNLHRQLLYDERDLGGAPKVLIAARRLRRINSELKIEARVGRFEAESAEALMEGVDLLIDACDQLESRALINERCLQAGLPWIYGGLQESQGMLMTFLPGGPCWRCLFPELPPSATAPSAVLNTLPCL